MATRRRKTLIEKDNYTTKVVNLFEAEKIQIPAECTVAVSPVPLAPTNLQWWKP
jgi:hypothetical protein